MLHGIEDTEPRDAFSLISERSGKRIVVENSKSIEWTKVFVGRPDRDLHVIHILKDPRGRWASLRRRKYEHTVLEDAIEAWCVENIEIADFTQRFCLPTSVVAYDIVAKDQRREFASLFSAIQTRFDPSALRYWEFDHHGFAANGASSALIEHWKFTSPPQHFATSDNAYYSNMFGQTFVDERWRMELPQAEIEAVTANPKVKQVLERLGYKLTETGIERIEEVRQQPSLSTVRPEPLSPAELSVSQRGRMWLSRLLQRRR